MDARAIAPGCYPDMTNDEYQSGPGTSKSQLDAIAPPNSPAHFYEKYLNPNREPEVRTPALILGDAIHKAILEPDLVATNFVTVPEDAPTRPSSRQRTAKKQSPDTLSAIEWWDSFNLSALGKTILSAADHKTVIGVRDSVHRHPVARGLFVGGAPEQTYFSIDPETGELIRCRIDYDRLAREGMMVDLKTTEDASPNGFGRSAANYRYHVQGGWYPHVVEQLGAITDTFVFVAVEKKPPYAIGIYYIEAEDAHMGMVEARRDLAQIIECREAGAWPDYGFKPQPLQIPAWKRRQVENV